MALYSDTEGQYLVLVRKVAGETFVFPGTLLESIGKRELENQKSNGAA